jgi:hypothetical protein
MAMAEWRQSDQIYLPKYEPGEAKNPHALPRASTNASIDDLFSQVDLSRGVLRHSVFQQVA